MKRGGLSALLVTVSLGLGMATLVVCANNCAEAARLDALHRNCQDLIIRNAHSRAKISGHRPGSLEDVVIEVSE